jgi:glucose/arabinose dehydrogenase
VKYGLTTALLSLACLTSPRPAAAQDSGKSLPRLEVQVAFPNLRFDRPVAMADPGDGSNRLFVVEQHQAKVWSFTNERNIQTKHLFLELPDPINRGNEEGLLGLAFHPNFRQNQQFFVYYSANDKGSRRSVVSRFTTSRSDRRRADPASEQQIWVSAEDPYENHNGGTIAFGKDGFLYIALGDGGAADDPLDSGQNPRDWFASILRIDVDHPETGKAYGIPADNPARRSSQFSHWAPEVYAIGLRNVWKFSFDRKTGDLWAGDVGQNLWEMVHRVENGGNYGWSLREGFHPFMPQRRRRPDPASPIRPPIAEYPHAPTAERPDSGLSITGGYVYRGSKIPALSGVYIYGDYDTGRIWGLRYADGQLITSGEIVDLRGHPKLNIASFGEDSHGELYILAFDGKIYGLVPAAKP